MDQWYANIAGQQYGPVPFETLQQWVREGRVTSADLVWSPGMPQWRPAGGVEGLGLGGSGVAAGPSLRPHRGATVLVLGILGLALCFILGIIAWVMGNNDLRDIDAGVMDASGRGLTQAGRVCGIISTCVGLVELLFMCLWVGVFGGSDFL